MTPSLWEDHRSSLKPNVTVRLFPEGSGPKLSIR
jgi:hypothetical protein